MIKLAAAVLFAIMVAGLVGARSGEDVPPASCAECVTDSECEALCAPARMED